MNNGEPSPSGTIITLKIYDKKKLDHIFVMEKEMIGILNIYPKSAMENGHINHLIPMER